MRILKLGLALPALAILPLQGQSATVEFNRDIRPILSDNCFTCHGPDKAHRVTNLRFDVEEDAKQALRGGRHAIVPGDSASSELIARVSATNATHMPPASTGKTLSVAQIDLLKRWIDEGAVWEKHWSFIPPKRPALPNTSNSQWVRNPIDHFILARLDREGLKPSPEAKRAALARRVSFDLTGIPPTPAEVTAFVNDNSPQAYEEFVDRLLGSPRYGERMLYPWLDAARYADSNGYQTDGERRMWPWRDWVIGAFNKNMPFDQFTVEQLAGDLLPNATPSQRIATGVNRNHRLNSEGGIIPEEYAAEYVMDRVDTTSTVFLGLTIGCARCHDHRYDPIATKEYYQLFAYFNNVPESGKAKRTGNSPPFIKVPSPEQAAMLAQLDRDLAAARAAYASLGADRQRAQQTWEETLASAERIYGGTTRGLVYQLKPDATFAPSPFGPAKTFDGKAFIDAGQNANFRTHGYQLKHPNATGRLDDAFTFTAWFNSQSPDGAIVAKGQDEPEPLGYGVFLNDGKIQFYWTTKWVDEGIRLEAQTPVTLGMWHHVSVSYDGTRSADGVKVFLDGAEQKLNIALDDFNNQAYTGVVRDPLRIGGGGGVRFQGQIADVRAYDRALTAEEVAQLAVRETIQDIVAKSTGQRTPAEAAKLAGYFLENAAPQPIRAAWNKVLSAETARAEFYEDIPDTMVMAEMPQPRETHVLLRGSYEQPGEVVKPAVPAILPPMPAGAPANRLGLARWLVDPSNPLLARVTVNRFWQMYFGTGLVKTSEDFGAQGEAPSHPELLDWLATEFIRTGWDIKAMQRLIVTSATYRQASATTPALIERDPDNRLLARGPVLRLSAEMVRDQALALSGLLVEKLGGPSVKPYQPAGLWAELSNEEYKQDHNDGLYRRSLYTFWRRTVPPPTMASFDAAGRESCVVRPAVTNTPLQALDLMNNVTFLEAARMIGERMLKEGGATPEERIAFGFRLATGRAPSALETTLLVRAFQSQLERFEARPGSAEKYLTQGESPRAKNLTTDQLAAYATIASMMLNLDEVVTKE